MKITDKILIIPPYISTAWTQVAALHMKGNLLAITLTDGDTINVPGLKQDVIESIFNFHAAYLEKEPPLGPMERQLAIRNRALMEQGFDIPFRFGLGSLEGITNVMQHNPAQADAPLIPEEIIDKICAITKIMSPDETLLPIPEADCNCPHCQIARALHDDYQHIEIFEEAVVTEAELQFQQWQIDQTGDKLYTVINRLDDQERYNVFLGEPVGCTCGKEGCEHILAVLKS